MLRQARVAVSFVLAAFLLVVQGTSDANAASKLPDPLKAGVAEQLFRLDCGHSLANDESVWTPGENVGRSIEFSTCRNRAEARRHRPCCNIAYAWRPHR